MIYDYIIIGSGLGGLSAGLNLTLNSKKVLILEKNSLPGGATTTFKKGRFEFDTALYDLYNYGNSEHIGELQNIFNEYDLSIDGEVVPFNALINALDLKKPFEIKGNIEDFFIYLEHLKPGSITNLKKFLKVIKEIHDSILEIEKGVKVKNEYFLKYLDTNAYDALIDIGISKEIIPYLSFLWIQLGSPLNKLSFIDYAEFMYKIIFKKRVVLNIKNMELIFNMVNKYRDKHGKIIFNAEVVNINKNKDYVLVETKDQKEYKCKHLICDLMPRYVYKDLLKATPEINKLENARTIGANSLVVYLGLNKDCKTLGLKHYKYYNFNNLNSIINIKSMNSFYHSTFEAIVPNVVNEDVSPKNTTIMVLKTDYYGDAWAKVNKSNYHKLKEDLANNLIEQFERYFNIELKAYIEEIEIVTPFAFEKLTNNINGSMYGYMRKGYDNSINRLVSYEDEKDPNISFVGGSSLFGNGADNAIKSGYFITNKLLNKDDF